MKCKDCEYHRIYNDFDYCLNDIIECPYIVKCDKSLFFDDEYEEE